MAEVIGVLPVKINQKFSITLTDFSVDKSANTKVHKGAFGAYGTSKGPEDVAGSFKVSIPAAGLEFDFDSEFALPGGSLQVKSPAGGYKKGYRSVVLSKTSTQVSQETGTTTIAYNFTAEGEVNL